jgi:hypothetical protein
LKYPTDISTSGIVISTERIKRMQIFYLVDENT